MTSLADRLRYSGIARRLSRFNVPKVGMFKPSTVLLTGIIIAVSIFILGGGVFDLLEHPLALLPTSSGSWLFIYPGLYSQTWNESIFSMSLLALGIAGTFVCYRSTRYAFKPRQATILLLLGTVLIVISILGFEYALYVKLNTSTTA
jgi:O-antigen ligase